jgi:DNA-binding NtrC family response regulator
MQYDALKKKVLLIEDEPYITRLCERVLLLQGFNVDIVTSGLTAKELINRTKYDLCISDIRIPGISGIELYDYLLNKYPELVLRTIFMSGDLLNPQIINFILKYTVAFLPKPFSPDDLVTKVNEVIEMQYSLP